MILKNKTVPLFFPQTLPKYKYKFKKYVTFFKCSFKSNNSNSLDYLKYFKCFLPTYTISDFF